MKKIFGVILSCIIIANAFSACSLSDTPASENSYDGGSFSKETIRILSGSENKELSEILAECSKKQG